MTIQSLGYIGVRSGHLDDWSDFGSRVLGLQRVDKTNSSVSFRMDDRKQRVTITKSSPEGVGFFGWEVPDAAALNEMGARLEATGAAVVRGSRALADERHVADLLICHDPAGNRVEIFHSACVASESFKPGRSISGFRTGPLGMGHVVMTLESAELLHEMVAFYDNIGFHLTDYYSTPFEARFLHVNQRHHSLALIQSSKNTFHHLMMELFSFDDVGHGYDLVMSEEKVATTLGRHTSDFMTSFYAWTPSKFMVEYGWGGRSIDPESWTPHERSGGASIWGHDRIGWSTEEVNRRSRELKRQNADKGLRAPVQVIKGNYEVMPGVCPWWDQVSNGEKF